MAPVQPTKQTNTRLRLGHVQKYVRLLNARKTSPPSPPLSPSPTHSSIPHVVSEKTPTATQTRSNAPVMLQSFSHRPSKVPHEAGTRVVFSNRPSNKRPQIASCTRARATLASGVVVKTKAPRLTRSPDQLKSPSQIEVEGSGVLITFHVKVIRSLTSHP